MIIVLRLTLQDSTTARIGWKRRTVLFEADADRSQLFTLIGFLIGDLTEQVFEWIHNFLRLIQWW